MIILKPHKYIIKTNRRLKSPRLYLQNNLELLWLVKSEYILHINNQIGPFKRALTIATNQ